MRVLLLSGIDSPEFRSISADLASILPGVPVDHSRNVHASAERIGLESRYPDLLVVVQHSPDEFTRGEIAKLFEIAPLARWICCYGPWCESDGRNRDLWPPGSRVSFDGFRTRLLRELSVLRAERAQLPLTASRDEIFAYDCAEISNDATRLRVRIDTPDPAVRQWLVDLVTTAGHQAVAPESESELIILDLDPWTNREPRRNPGQWNGPSRVIGLMGMPCREDVDAARAIGIDSLLSKLAPLDELIAALSC